jgi:hypothetical protein
MAMKIEDRGKWVCMTCPALTLFLPDAPTRAEILKAWGAYKSVCPASRLTFVKSAGMNFFERLESAAAPGALDPYLAEQDRRRDEGISVWDGVEDEAGWSFDMRGVVLPGGTPSASYCRVFFPDDVHEDLIHQLAIALAESIPFLSGYGGYTCAFDPWKRGFAFNQIYAWAKRYLGLDVDDLNATLPGVLRAIKGADWLTLVGNSLWQRLAEEAGGPPRFDPPVMAERRQFGWVIRAGEHPVLADRNRREFPEAYAAVERVLLPIKTQSHPEFAGRFEEEGATMAWLRRLVEPENW